MAGGVHVSAGVAAEAQLADRPGRFDLDRSDARLGVARVVGHAVLDRQREVEEAHRAAPRRAAFKRRRGWPSGSSTVCSRVRAPQQVEDYADDDQHDQRDDLREFVLQTRVGEAQGGQGIVGVGVLAEPVHAEARPDESHGGQQRPEGGQHRQDPGHGHASRHPVGPLDVGVGVAQTHERRKMNRYEIVVVEMVRPSTA